MIKFFGGKYTNNNDKGNAAVLSSTVAKTIDKREFIVKSYYTGKKNIDDILTRIAVSKAYEDIRNEYINKNFDNYLSQDLAKSEVI